MRMDGFVVAIQIDVYAPRVPISRACVTRPMAHCSARNLPSAGYVDMSGRPWERELERADVRAEEFSRVGGWRCESV